MRKEKWFFFSYPSKTSLTRMANHILALPQKVSDWQWAGLIQIIVVLSSFWHLYFWHFIYLLCVFQRMVLTTGSPVELIWVKLVSAATASCTTWPVSSPTGAKGSCQMYVDMKTTIILIHLCGRFSVVNQNHYSDILTEYVAHASNVVSS